MATTMSADLMVSTSLAPMPLAP
ncbi:hypothetical protein DSM3645_03083 [Blastopirellula marina DSM 3645]|uniref:Uncharacterized protein n=1 Tax=Blastopirellula marina DSM 3645 TaxID=314230 RepID=A3ZVT0_9BACT|nr:hypothetical protein DSM3645_03083 [Blastopirellula marina DSM 3645]